MDPKDYDIVEIVGHYLELEDKGDNHMACCPFHDDSTASLGVYQDTCSFSCFAAGCDSSGDALDFIQKMDEVPYKAAVKIANKICGIKEGTEVESSQAKVKQTKTPKKSKVLDPDYKRRVRKLSTDPKGYRGLSEEVCKFFDVRHEYDPDSGGVTRQYYPCTTHNKEGKTKLVGYKSRITPKKFLSSGSVGKEVDPFGYFKFKDARGKFVVITAGEIDQLSAFQMLKKYTDDKGGDYDYVPVVCSTLGEGGVSQLRDKFEWFNRFDKIIICFDPDEAGEKAVEDAAKVLPRGKVHVMKLIGDDTNHYLVNKMQKKWISAFYNAPKYTMQGITGSSSLMDKMRDHVSLERVSLPPEMYRLQEALRGGFPLGYIVNLMSASGSGKSTILDACVMHWIIEEYKRTGPVGIVSLEASEGEYGVNLSSSYIKTKINLGSTVQSRLDIINDNEGHIMNLFKDEDGNDRFYLVDAEIDNMKQKIEYMVVALGCKIICIDPIQDIFDALPDDEQAKFMKWQKDLVKREKVLLINISHSRKAQSGQKAGSSGGDLKEEDMMGHSSIYKSGGINIIFMRDKEAEDPIKRNMTFVKLTKSRGVGDTGPVGMLYYEKDTHQLYDGEDWLKRNGETLSEED